MIIDRVENKIFRHRKITIVNSKKEVVIRINRINPTTENSISQNCHENFSMILRGKIQILMRMDVHNMNKVRAVDHSFLIAIFVGRVDIMQINV